ncbi:uncharacterized protein DS421_5g143690 [Arachis hypogaea]|nr:uncharacterized protein DS421_5g143690 [Arachis hypogaea]
MKEGDAGQRREERRHRSCPVHPCQSWFFHPSTHSVAGDLRAAARCAVLVAATASMSSNGAAIATGGHASRRACHCPRTAADPCCAKPTALFLPSLATGFRPSLSLRELTGVVEVVTALCGSVLSCAGKPLRPENAPAAVAGKFCHCRDRNSSPLQLEVAAGLPPNRFGDRRCFGSAIPSWFGRVVEIVAKVAWNRGFGGILIVDFGSRRKGFCDAFGLWFCLR